MRFVEVGGARLSAIGLGTWQFGSREWGYGDEYADTTAIGITHRAIELGINLIDTAEIYGFGRSERIVGRAIADRRDKVFVATKVFPVMPLSSIVQQRAIASADRLGITEIDLYQVHWPNPVVPISQTMQGMQRLQRTGIVRHVGVSNFGLAAWQQAEKSLGGPVLSNQVQYSLAVRKPDRDLVPWAQQNGRVIIAYSPLAQGFLSAKYDGTNNPTGVRAGNSLFLPENIERAQPLFAALREIATAHDATPAQVALAWVIRRPNVVAIPGASSIAQLEANAAAADLELTDDDDHRLTEASDQFDAVGGPAAFAQLLKNRLTRR
jgi:aryl-alcohol dehydrogenase-like predicted oxidoreductase